MIIKKDQSVIQNYLQDCSGVCGANADFVAIAEAEHDISEFLVEMSKSDTSVTVAGALTGNTASGLAFGGAVLSLEKLNKIGKIDKIDDKNAVIAVQAGARLNDIKLEVYKAGWMYPPDPTESSSSIGGNISTNASGGRGFKFGSTRDYIKALKVIFSDGSSCFVERGEYCGNENGKIIFDTDKGKKQIVLPKYHLPIIKNAAGYYNYPGADLVDVFIGSEGTLGVIVEAVLKLIPRFTEVFGGIIFFKKRNDAYEFVNKVKDISKKTRKQGLKDSINAMSLEYFDENTLHLISSDYPTIPRYAEAAIMFEQDVYEDNNQDILMEKWIEIIENCGINLETVWFASNLIEQEHFRVFRHKIPERVNEMVKKTGIAKVGTDFAVPEGCLSNIVDFCDKEFKKVGAFNLTFGHIGENHLHANIVAVNDEEYKKCRQVYANIAQKVVELGGTVSAEHGIGKLRHVFLKKMIGEEGFKEMAKFKSMFDNYGILGCDNIFPKKYSQL
ncbi:MAG: FAD-binding oxidoreductase [Endomicrobium sp.]|jgi:D-lactate dehydrogenase (cytochrome)|nr:FAD-binding oxidoreductase [Endomicrobium sp.]